jgi:hypothetical protein
MNRTFGHTSLTLALLALTLAATLSIGSDAGRDAVTTEAPVVSMQLQSYAEEHESAAALDAPEAEKAAHCMPHERHCLSSKQDLALARADERPAHESKAFAAPSDETPAKHRR